MDMTSSAKTRTDGLWWVAAACLLAVSALLVSATWAARRPSAFWSAGSPVAEITAVTGGVGIVLGVVVMTVAGRAVLKRRSGAALATFAISAFCLAFSMVILIF